MNSVTLYDYARVVVKAWGWVLVVTVLAGGVAYGYGLMQPRVYRATAVVLAPREGGGAGMSGSIGALLATVGASGGSGGGGAMMMPSLSGSVPTMTTTLDTFVAILRSRTLRDEVLTGLEAEGLKVRGAVLGVEPSGAAKATVSLTVEATDPTVAARVANAYFEFLDRRLQRTAETAAKRQEAAYVAQLQRAAREVDVAEQELVKFQTENRMLATTESGTKAQTEGGAMLRGQIMSMELQREVMRMRVTDQHPDMREMDKRIAELKKQYSRNLFGAAMDLPPEGPNAKGGRKEFFVSADKMTPVQFAYLKLLRNLKIQEAFYLGAVQGLQQIQYNGGATRPPDIETLDPALPPSGAARPNMRMIVPVGVAIGLVVAVFLVLTREAVTRAFAEYRRTRPVTPPRSPRRPDGNGATTAEPSERRRQPAPTSGTIV